MLTRKEQELLDVLTPRADQEHVEIVTIEIVGAKKAPTIRVYIDTDHGVSFDELSSAQEWIDDIIEAIDPFPGAYMLEISSPGIDRPLRTPDHFKKQVGQTAVIKTVNKIEGRATFTGLLVSADDQGITVDCDGTSYDIPYDQVKRANIKGVFDFGS